MLNYGGGGGGGGGLLYLPSHFVNVVDHFSYRLFKRHNPRTQRSVLK